jgi:hypothetical protein
MSRNFLVDFLGSFRYKIMLSANKDSLTFSFTVWISFISSFCFIALARNSKICYISVDRMDTFVSFLMRGNCFIFSPFSMMLDVSLSYIAFVLRNIPSIPSFIKIFIMKGCWVLSKAFSEFIEMIIWFLSLFLLICCHTLNNLYMLNHHCIPGMKPTWLWCMIFLRCFLIQFTNSLLRIFASMLIKDIGL